MSLDSAFSSFLLDKLLNPSSTLKGKKEIFAKGFEMGYREGRGRAREAKQELEKK